MLNIFALAVFLGFIALVVAVSVTRRRREMVNLLIVYVLTVTAGVAATQLDLWPFSAWPLIAAIHPPTASSNRIAAVDALGREQAIDARAYGTLPYIELLAWADGAAAKLTPAQRRAAFLSLLDRVESARAEWPRHVHAPLGPLTAPYFILTPHIWDGSHVPAARFVALRLYRDTWTVEDLASSRGSVAHELRFEVRR